MKRLFSLFFIITAIGFAQNQPVKKEYIATKISKAPKIDGVLDDDVWQNLPEAGDFVMIEPGDGTPERDTHKTKVKVAYTDEAVYVAAYMYDHKPDEILRQFSQRDNINSQADFFFVTFNTYNNGINETQFVVTSAGTLADASSENGRDDFSWSTVFRAEVSFDDKGWYAEFKIPYYALRFPKKDEQLWGLQFLRQIKHLNETYTWNYTNKAVGASSQYAGLLKGIKNITPPTRLSFFPFMAVNQEFFDGTSDTNFSAGMDIKYGISDSFTLDATLIPDFGQAKFDDVRLNLGPFEQTFSENRQFFTEGVELFNKGGLFYSRRIGGRPSASGAADDNLGEHEEVIDNPSDVKLLNSVKVSGRTKEGLGIGFINSITQETNAVVRDTISGATRNVVTEPIANYNVLVLDQQFNNNSSISLVNTNVTRSGHFRDANVSAFVFNVNNKKNSYNFNGQATMSQVNDIDGNKPGFASRFGIRRTKGKLRFGLWNNTTNKTYDINDLGISFRTNLFNSGGNVSYEIFEPTERFNKYRINFWFNHNRRLYPNIFVSQQFGVNVFAIKPSRLAFGGGINGRTKEKDFFEPRTEGRFLERDGHLGGDVWISTDFRKKFAWEANFSHRQWFNTPETGLSLRFEPRYRFSDNFLLIYEIRQWFGNNKLGYITTQDNDDIIIGQRNVQDLENSITASYNFNSRQALNLSFRNFWSTASYKDNKFFVLNENGTLTDTNYDTSDNDPNTNFNIWNLDVTYNWRFAPGSEAILLYRHQIFNQDEFAEASFGDSFNTLFKQPIQHTLSLKVVYFLDYNNIKHLLKKSNS